MEYTYLGRTGVRVSRICLGTAAFGVRPLAEDVDKLVHGAMDLGINFFDTANSYGNAKRFDQPGAPSFEERESAETILGKALRGRRDDVILATKVREPVGSGINDYGLSRRHIVHQVDRSLRALQTDYIDLYQAHSVDWETPLEETVQTFDDLVRQGKIRYWGLSGHPAWRVAAAVGLCRQHGLHEPVTDQIGWNIVNRVLEADVIPACRHFGIGITTFHSLAGGLLSGPAVRSRPLFGFGRVFEDKKMAEGFSYPADQLEAAERVDELAADWGCTPSQLSLAWLFSRPNHVSAIVGSETLEELAECIPAVDLELEAAQLAMIDDLLPPAPIVAVERTGVPPSWRPVMERQAAAAPNPR